MNDTKFQPSQVQWCVEDDNGDETSAVAGVLQDGVYTVMQPIILTDQYYRSAKTVTVADGKIDIRACQEAVAEFLNENDDYHSFIETVTRGPEPQTIKFILGS